MLKKSFLAVLLILIGCATVSKTGSSSSTTGFKTVSDQIWDETAVRRVLHTFAYGGQTTEDVIRQLANMPPEEAIKHILSFKNVNLTISNPVNTTQLWQKTDGTLRGLGEFWSSDDQNNEVPKKQRNKYAITDRVRVDIIWLRATVSRGLNPFRQKIGLWETNYHMATNLNSAVNQRQMLRYYDDILNSLAETPYHQTLSIAATSAAIALQYGHHRNVHKKGKCQCNEDFAREYHQLFFGILGKDDPVFHEEVTIKNTAKALTDMKVKHLGKGRGWTDEVTFGTKQHWPGPLNILQSLNTGSTALERIESLSKLAIFHPESLENLPVIIVRGLADDNLDEADLAEIRAAWAAMPDKNLLSFLRAYAISTQFHDPSRVKYLSSLDRRMLINSQMILNNAEINYYSLAAHLHGEQAYPFKPKHNVFGGQTGAEAASSPDLFRNHYNSVTERQYQFTKVKQENWRKDWTLVIPKAGTNRYQVEKVGEFLWNRFIGDGLKNYATLERTYVNALLATGHDWAYWVAPNALERVFTTQELETVPELLALRADFAEERMIALGMKDEGQRQEANRRIGLAISFIVGTPYIFAQEGR